MMNVKCELIWYTNAMKQSVLCDVTLHYIHDVTNHKVMLHIIFYLFLPKMHDECQI